MAEETQNTAFLAVDLWIDELIAKHAGSRVRLSEVGHSRLPDYFSPRLLETAYFVLVTHVVTPPLSDLGQSNLEFFESEKFEGIAYKDTFFATSADESLHFHELIHIIQWDELGPEKFIGAYISGLITHGYHEAPLEKIAYEMQAHFDARNPIENLESKVRQHCRELVDV